MNKEKRKNIIISILVVALLLLSTIAIYNLFLKETSNYPEDPVEQKSLTPSDGRIDTAGMIVDGDVEQYIWQISNQVKLDLVREMVDSLNGGFKIIDSEEGEYYQWSNGRDEILFDISKNYLLFQYTEGITFNEAEITNNSFSNFVNQYYKEGWKYDVFKSEKSPGGEIVYYAKRLLTEDLVVEAREHYQQTDYLALKNGKIVYGKLLLANFIQTDILVPLVDTGSLSKYLNLPEYPKEIYPQYGALSGTVLDKVDYLSEEFEEIAESLDNCKAITSKVIYLYKSFDQDLLTPVFRMDVECEITYDNQAYSVPAVAYINAIDPEYVTIPE